MARTRPWTAPAAAVERERTRQVARIGSNVNRIARLGQHLYASAAEAVAHLVAIQRALAALAPVGRADPDVHSVAGMCRRRVSRRVGRDKALFEPAYQFLRLGDRRV